MSWLGDKIAHAEAKISGAEAKIAHKAEELKHEAGQAVGHIAAKAESAKETVVHTAGHVVAKAESVRQAVVTEVKADYHVVHDLSTSGSKSIPENAKEREIYLKRMDQAIGGSTTAINVLTPVDNARKAVQNEAGKVAKDVVTTVKFEVANLRGDQQEKMRLADATIGATGRLSDSLVSAQTKIEQTRDDVITVAKFEVGDQQEKMRLADRAIKATTNLDDAAVRAATALPLGDPIASAIAKGTDKAAGTHTYDTVGKHGGNKTVTAVDHIAHGKFNSQDAVELVSTAASLIPGGKAAGAVSEGVVKDVSEHVVATALEKAVEKIATNEIKHTLKEVVAKPVTEIAMNEFKKSSSPASPENKPIESPTAIAAREDPKHAALEAQVAAANIHKNVAAGVSEADVKKQAALDAPRVHSYSNADLENVLKQLQEPKGKSALAMSPSAAALHQQAVVTNTVRRDGVAGEESGKDTTKAAVASSIVSPQQAPKQQTYQHDTPTAVVASTTPASKGAPAKGAGISA